ncbi:MAG: hypothetical protein QM803_05570 [Rhodocyclaceae bacterium]
MKAATEVILTTSNLATWPAFGKLFNEGKVVADGQGRLRYPHGAPVGKMVQVGTHSDGTPKYRESAEEWFDPESKKAREFVWPK